MAVRFIAALLATAVAAAAHAAVPPQMSVDLIASTLAPRSGSTVLVGFRMAPKPGWHGYWSNAGGSGIAPTVEWSAPAGVRFGPLLHPAPTLFKSMGVVSFVHAGEHVLLSKMAVPASVRAGTPIPVQAELNWAVCSADLCVPGHATFSLPLVVGSGAAGKDADVLRQALARVPPSVSGGSYWSDAGSLTLTLPLRVRLNGASARFFPDENGFFDTTRAVASAGPPMTIAAPLTGTPPGHISGVVSDGRSSYRLSLQRQAPESPPTVQAAAVRAEQRDTPKRSATVQPTPAAAAAAEITNVAPPPSRQWLVWLGGAAAIGAGMLLLAVVRRRRS